MGDSAISIPQYKIDAQEKDQPEQIETKPAEERDQEEEEAVLIPVQAATFSASPEAKPAAPKKASDAKPKPAADTCPTTKSQPSETTKKPKDPESVPLVIPKKAAPQATKPKPPKATKKAEPEEDTMKTPMIKSAVGIKISKEEQMKLQNQKIADDFFDQEQQENAMLVMRLPNTVGAAGSDDDSDEGSSRSPVKQARIGPTRSGGESATIKLGIVPEEAEESQQEPEEDG